MLIKYYLPILHQQNHNKKRDNLDDHQNDKSTPNGTNKEETSNLPSPQQALNLIRHRRSIFPKQYTGTSIPKPIIQDILESAQWAPTHKLTQPWRFIIFESMEAKEKLGNFLAESYKSSQLSKGKEVSMSKYDKKVKNCKVSSHVIAIIVDYSGETKNPIVEEIASVSSAVQNMQLIASSYKNVGAYWSTGCLYNDKGNEDESMDQEKARLNSDDVIDFLKLGKDELCLGWLFIGTRDDNMKWPSGRRISIIESDTKVQWF